MKIASFYILVVLLITSCESVVENFEVRKPEDKLVIVGYAMSDSVPAFFVTNNLGLEDALVFNPILNATAELYAKDILIGNLNLSDSNWYMLNGYSLESGENYSLVVSAPGYKQVTAEFAVPEKPQIVGIDTSFIQETPSNCIGCTPNYNMVFNIEFVNQPEADEYFSVELLLQASYPEDYYWNNNDSISELTYLFSNAPFVESGRNYGDNYVNFAADEIASGKVLYFSDRLLEPGNNLFTFNTTIETYKVDTNSAVTYTLTFKKIDKHMFEYVQSKGRNNNAENNPFVQPVSIYTNVQNGLGLVSGLSKFDTLFQAVEIYKKASRATENYNYY